MNARASRQIGQPVANAEANMKTDKESSTASLPPGIVIQHPVQPAARPSIAAFIWGGEIQPVPSLPYGRANA
jgi:hypothetical protein